MTGKGGKRKARPNDRETRNRGRRAKMTGKGGPRKAALLNDRKNETKEGAPN